MIVAVVFCVLALTALGLAVLPWSEGALEEASRAANEADRGLGLLLAPVRAVSRRRPQ
jgi:hypothetical protein